MAKLLDLNAVDLLPEPMLSTFHKDTLVRKIVCIYESMWRNVGLCLLMEEASIGGKGKREKANSVVL